MTPAPPEFRHDGPTADPAKLADAWSRHGEPVGATTAGQAGPALHASLHQTPDPVGPLLAALTAAHVGEVARLVEEVGALRAENLRVWRALGVYAKVAGGFREFVDAVRYNDMVAAGSDEWRWCAGVRDRLANDLLAAVGLLGDIVPLALAPPEVP